MKAMMLQTDRAAVRVAASRAMMHQNMDSGADPKKQKQQFVATTSWNQVN